MKQEVRFTVILSLTKKVSVRMLGWVKSEKIGFFKKWTIPDLFFVYFRPFKQTLQFLQQIYVKKCYDHPEYGTGIQTHNLRNTSLLP